MVYMGLLFLYVLKLFFVVVILFNLIITYENKMKQSERSKKKVRAIRDY